MILNLKLYKRKEKHYYIIYQIINKINKKFYVGAHSTNNLNDGYFGSGWALEKAIKKYGKENFIKEILYFCLNEKEMFRLEGQIVNDEFVKSKETYNLVCGGNGGYISEQFYKELSIKMKGHSFSEETREKMRITQRNRKASEETKLKMSIARKGKKRNGNLCGENNPCFGKTWSPERRRKIEAKILERKEKREAFLRLHPEILQERLKIQLEKLVKKNKIAVERRKARLLLEKEKEEKRKIPYEHRIDVQMNDREWKDIKGYEGLYKVSSAGDILSVLYNKLKNLNKKPPAGYLLVCLCKNGKKTSFNVSQLVATAFLLNPKNYKNVHHIDWNVLNNNINNLEWADNKKIHKRLNK